jgi:hypothetical protein
MRRMAREIYVKPCCCDTTYYHPEKVVFSSTLSAREILNMGIKQCSAGTLEHV